MQRVRERVNMGMKSHRRAMTSSHDVEYMTPCDTLCWTVRRRTRRLQRRRASRCWRRGTAVVQVVMTWLTRYSGGGGTGGDDVVDGNRPPDAPSPVIDRFTAVDQQLSHPPSGRTAERHTQIFQRLLEQTDCCANISFKQLVSYLTYQRIHVTSPLIVLILKTAVYPQC